VSGTKISEYQRVLVTGSAGFIGSHMVTRLLERQVETWGIDVPIQDRGPHQRDRLEWIHSHGHCNLYHDVAVDIRHTESLALCIEEIRPDLVFHFAALPGVNPSWEQPSDYVTTNVLGTLNVLEAAASLDSPPRLLLASSSSVYGANDGHPVNEKDTTDWPLSIYAATKKADEAIAHAYAHKYGLAITMLRLFSVYGPWGRPDMAPLRLADSILLQVPVRLTWAGQQLRDYTYIDDVIDVLERLASTPRPETLSESGPRSFEAMNVGGGQPVPLLQVAETLASNLRCSLNVELLGPVVGEPEWTFGDDSALVARIGPVDWTPIDIGLAALAQWHLERSRTTAAAREFGEG